MCQELREQKDEKREGNGPKNSYHAGQCHVPRRNGRGMYNLQHNGGFIAQDAGYRENAAKKYDRQESGDDAAGDHLGTICL